MGSSVEIASSFLEGAPPGELQDVVNDIKALTDDTALLSKLKPAFQRYNEGQLLCVKLPGAANSVVISKYNRLSDSPSKYYDTASSTSFEFDHITQKPSNCQSYNDDTSSSRTSLIQSTLKSLSAHFAEHYPASPSAAYTVVASPENPSEIIIILSTTKVSPSNFISGRWRSVFTYDTSSSALSGVIQIQVHYYEDGNVALTTTKKIPSGTVEGAANGADIVRKVALVEKQYQEEVNRALVGMNEGSFKGLRRQLPVTRQRVEWDKVRSYSLGSALQGEGGKR